MFSPEERRYLETARVGRLATADADGRPHVVPACFALVDEAGGWIATPVDEKPKDAKPTDLRRVRDVRANARVALVTDHWTEAWDALGWVQVRGTADVLSPGDPGHADAVEALLRKYDQYADHHLADRPVIRIEPGHVLSWGSLERRE